MLRRPSVRPLSVRRSPQFQRSPSLKPHGQSKLNFMWNILRKGERKFIFGLGHMIMIVAMAVESKKKKNHILSISNRSNAQEIQMLA